MKNYLTLQRQCRIGESLVEFEGTNSTQEDTNADSICVDGNKTVTETDVQQNLARKQFFSSETATYGCNNLAALRLDKFQFRRC